MPLLHVVRFSYSLQACALLYSHNSGIGMHGRVNMKSIAYNWIAQQLFTNPDMTTRPFTVTQPDQLMMTP